VVVVVVAVWWWWWLCCCCCCCCCRGVVRRRLPRDAGRRGDNRHSPCLPVLHNTFIVYFITAVREAYQGPSGFFHGPLCVLSKSLTVPVKRLSARFRCSSARQLPDGHRWHTHTRTHIHTHARTHTHTHTKPGEGGGRHSLISCRGKAAVWVICVCVCLMCVCGLMRCFKHHRCVCVRACRPERKALLRLLRPSSPL
jgi:hypothetical protein